MRAIPTARWRSEMLTIFLDTLAHFRGQVLGWGLATFLMSVLTVIRWNIFQDNQEPMRQLLAGEVGDLMGMFGDVTRLTTPGGFLSLALFSFLPLVLGAFAVLAGSGLVVADEESGTLDLVLAHPVSRTALYLGRLLALVAATLIILAIAWVGLIIPMSGT